MSELFIPANAEFDYDQAACTIVESLGLYHAPDSTFGPAKWVFCSNNVVGNAITTFLDELATAGLLVRTDDRYRLAPGYDPAKFGDYCAAASPS